MASSLHFLLLPRCQSNTSEIRGPCLGTDPLERGCLSPGLQRDNGDKNVMAAGMPVPCSGSWLQRELLCLLGGRCDVGASQTPWHTDANPAGKLAGLADGHMGRAVEEVNC